MIIRKQDHILTDKLQFGAQAVKRQLILDTWSGLLMDEDSLPDDWINTPGVLVGIRPKKDGTGQQRGRSPTQTLQTVHNGISPLGTLPGSVWSTN
jgi:hypothetical protein